MKKIAIILSGCGHQEGTELTEAASVAICLSEAKIKYDYFAPEKVVNESGKISRGKTKNLSDLNSKDYDGLVLPGGHGVVKNLMNVSDLEQAESINPVLKKQILNFNLEYKPIAAICIAPVLIAKILGHKKPTLTVGNDTHLSSLIKKWGAIHENCPVTDYISDRDCKILSTPAYMYEEASAYEVYSGIKSMLTEFVEMC